MDAVGFLRITIGPHFILFCLLEIVFTNQRCFELQQWCDLWVPWINMLCGIILGIGILCVSNYRVIHEKCIKIAAPFFS